MSFRTGLRTVLFAVLGLRLLNGFGLLPADKLYVILFIFPFLKCTLSQSLLFEVLDRRELVNTRDGIGSFSARKITRFKCPRTCLKFSGSPDFGVCKRFFFTTSNVDKCFNSFIAFVYKQILYLFIIIFFSRCDDTANQSRVKHILLVGILR